MRSRGVWFKRFAMPGPARTRPMPKTLLGRMFANTAWLLGGKGFGAICSLVYLAVMTRSLGLKAFGHFSLIFGTSQALIALAGFQTWRVVVQYGATHVHNKDWGAFGRLSVLCGILDVAGAALGCLIAYVVFYQFGDALDINPTLVDTAFWFNCAMLWAIVSSPTGIVRALDRFDMAVYVEAWVPAARLICALAIWWTGPSLVKFLIAWAAIDLIETVIYWAVARRLCPQAVRLSHLTQLRRSISDNPGVIRFFMITYTSATLEAAIRHGPLLAVGYFANTSAAGLYRLAQQLTQGLTKLSTLLARAAYAEFARARIVSEMAEFRSLARQSTIYAGAAGAIIVLIAVAIGGQLFELLGGKEFYRGHEILIPLAIAASFDLASIAFEPLLHSTGRARNALIARAIALIAVVCAVLMLAGPYGAMGVAWSVSVGGAVSYLVMGALARHTILRIAREHRQKAEK